MPERFYFYVVTPDPETPVQPYRVDDYTAYVRLVCGQMQQVVAQDDEVVAAANYPDPVDHCDVCPWSSESNKKRHLDDHLSLVAGISRLQRRELESRKVASLAALATLLVPLDFKPKRGAAETYVRVGARVGCKTRSGDRQGCWLRNRKSGCLQLSRVVSSI